MSRNSLEHFIKNCSLGRDKRFSQYKHGSTVLSFLSVCVYVIFTKKVITPKHFELQCLNFAWLFILLGLTSVPNMNKISLTVSKWRQFKIFYANFHKTR